MVGNDMDAFPAILSLLPDLILLNISLLDMDAYEVARQLRTDSRTGEVILLALNG
jgi:CheY-like chemotaxis protein